MRALRLFSLIGMGAALGACTHTPESFYGTTEPFAAEAVYFVLTDRFVNGDISNDYRDQGGQHRTFDIPLQGPEGQTDNIGYLGGDFRGIVNHADYIAEMGFTSIWITPVVDNPDEAFAGGEPVTWGSGLKDQGKSGYHGYWGVNFYRLDEHLPSADLDFAELTRQLKTHGLEVVLDVVANHGSPSFTMPYDQPKFGELYDKGGTLVADHQNLPPERLTPQHNRLHRFFRTERDLAQLSNLNDENPAVQDYLINAVLQWLAQGAHALRIDTIRHVPHAFWRSFSERVRDRHPGLFMFGESFDYEAGNIAPHTWEQNGAISVLDFPMKAQLVSVFEERGSDFSELERALFLENGPYRNPYELMTFYDNHDMARMNAADDGFIDAHNWLFTARGIPVIYYGSEMAFMKGTAEHAGNRNYFGAQRIEQARTHPIRQQLMRIAQVRKFSPALQKGLQMNVRLHGDEAIFYRVFQHEKTNQTALVMLNKSGKPRDMTVDRYLQPGTWRDAFTGENIAAGKQLTANVPAHGVRIFFFDEALSRRDARRRLTQLMLRKGSH